jgi:hypothetical protein
MNFIFNLNAFSWKSMKPTQHFVAATEITRSLVFKVLGGLSL